MTSRAWRLSLIAAVALVLIIGLVLINRGGAARAGAQATTSAISVTRTSAQSPAGVPEIRIGQALPVRAVAPGFLGVSMEYYAIRAYAGTVASRPDPVFVQLLRNLAPGQRLVLRIGGDSADWLWLSTPGIQRSPALKVAITSRTIAVLAAVVRALDARVILDLNLESANLKLADNIARTITAAVGARHIAAYEVGNEPDLYDVLPFFRNTAGQPVLGRSPGYTLADYTAEFNRLGATLGSTPLAGPSTSRTWRNSLSAFIARARGLGMVTEHAYATQTCGSRPGLSTWPSISGLLSPDSTLGMVTALAPNIARAHAGGKTFRVDEINNVACFGLAGVSDRYGSALWALETSLQFARAGVDGLNFHTVPSAKYRLFVLDPSHGVWRGRVLPEYYGLLAFADAVPPRSRFLATPDTGANPQVFALRTPAGQTRVVIVNAQGALRLALRIPGAGQPALVTYLRGRSLTAEAGTTLAGQSFGAQTTSGRLRGRASGVEVRPVDRAYVVALPAHSAAILRVG